ncbi:MAG: hypothetical protein IJM19_01240 [Ruminococcus sp.]|nr:hypothetical protein [Ruminococcus sp.]MBR6384679.1 hypothetical protein [Ruminococcus sp.]
MDKLDKTSVSEIFHIPKFYYFQSGNDYSGSKGDFSYIIKNGEKLKCMTWHGKLCSEKAVIENEQEFEKSQEGFDKLIKWLESMFE